MRNQFNSKSKDKNCSLKFNNKSNKLRKTSNVNMKLKQIYNVYLNEKNLNENTLYKSIIRNKLSKDSFAC